MTATLYVVGVYMNIQLHYVLDSTNSIYAAVRSFAFLQTTADKQNKNKTQNYYGTLQDGTPNNNYLSSQDLVNYLHFERKRGLDLGEKVIHSVPNQCCNCAAYDYMTTP